MHSKLVHGGWAGRWVDGWKEQEVRGEDLGAAVLLMHCTHTSIETAAAVVVVSDSAMCRWSATHLKERGAGSSRGTLASPSLSSTLLGGVFLATQDKKPDELNKSGCHRSNGTCPCFWTLPHRSPGSATMSVYKSAAPKSNPPVISSRKRARTRCMLAEDIKGRAPSRREVARASL